MKTPAAGGAGIREEPPVAFVRVLAVAVAENEDAPAIGRCVGEPMNDRDGARGRVERGDRGEIGRFSGRVVVAPDGRQGSDGAQAREHAFADVSRVEDMVATSERRNNVPSQVAVGIGDKTEFHMDECSGTGCAPCDLGAPLRGLVERGLGTHPRADAVGGAVAYHLHAHRMVP